MLISAFSCGCTVVLPFPTDFTIEDMLFDDVTYWRSYFIKVGLPRIDVVDDTPRPFFGDIEDIDVLLPWKTGKTWIQRHTFETCNCDPTPNILDGGALPPFVSCTFQLKDLTTVAPTNLKSINARR